MRVITNAIAVGLLIWCGLVQGDPTNSWLDEVQPLKESSLFAEPEADTTPIIESLKSAQQSIWMEIFNLSHPEIVETLISLKAQNPKIDIKIIIDRFTLMSSKNFKVYKQLQDSGIDVYASSSGFEVTHTKSFLVDYKFAANQRLLISTINFNQSISDSRDFGFFTSDPDVIEDWVKVFLADLRNSLSGGTETPALSHPNLIVSNTNARSKLVDLLMSAQSSIDIEMENMGDPEIQSALTRQAQNGVQIRMILPECAKNFSPTQNYIFLYSLKNLKLSNLNIRVIPNPTSEKNPYMHAKMIVIDKKLAFIGSENFSTNSLNLSREIGIVFSENLHISKLLKWFSIDWDRSVQLPEKKTNTCRFST